MGWIWYCKKCEISHNTDVCPKCGGLMEQVFEKVCPETGETCEYEPADDEPCHQCRVHRYMQRDKDGKI